MDTSSETMENLHCERNSDTCIVEKQCTTISLEVTKKEGDNVKSRPFKTTMDCNKKNLKTARQFATIILMMLISLSSIVAMLKNVYEKNDRGGNSDSESFFPSFNQLNYTLLNDTIKVFDLK